MMVINRQFTLQNQKFEQMMSKKKKKKLCAKGKTEQDTAFQCGPRRNTIMFKPDAPSLLGMANIVKEQ